MLGPPMKAKAPSDSGAQGSQVLTLNAVNSATSAANWKYRVRKVLGRFFVVSPLGTAIENCRTEASAARMAAGLNAGRGMEHSQ